MKLSQFKFDVPKELIAQYPLDNRDESRMMVVNREAGTIEHKKFSDLIDYFDEGDVMVMNDTRVFPARMYGNKEKTGAVIEVFLLRELNRESLLWDVLVDPARKIRIGNKLYFGEDEDLVAEVIDNTTSRGRTLRFLFDGTHEEFRQKVFSLGETPLPKYIDRPVEPEDAERFQTIYAKQEGAVAVPTAGLHMSKQLMKRFEIKGIDTAFLTLHIGLGTFRQLKTYDGWTSRFIFPPYKFKLADALITNFHTPQSTLLMLTAAFGGYDLIMEAYQTAMKEKYRMHAYGDALLVI